MEIVTLVSLFVMLALPAANEPVIADLVVSLGAPNYAEREAAGEAIVRIGRAALPELLRARENRDPEIRQRAEILVARIEANEAYKATSVRLEIHDRPLAEAVEEIERESGMRIRPGADAGRAVAKPSWPDARVTLVADEPVPFWEVVNRLCGAGNMQRQYTPAVSSFFPWKSPFQLTLVPGRARPPASDAGALRVELLRVKYDRNLDYANDGRRFTPFDTTIDDRPDPKTGGAVASSYRAELQVSAEPRLRIIGVGAVEGVEAVDEQGRSLVQTATAEESRRREQMLRQNPHIDPALHPELRYQTGGTSTRWSSIAVPLTYPTPCARRIAKLRGVIPVAVLSRRPGPLEVDLKGAVDKTFGPGPTRITVHAITTPPGAEPTIDLTVEAPPDAPDETVPVCDPKGVRFHVRRPQDLVELRLEVLDAHGEPRFWQFTSAPNERTRGRMTIIIHRNNNEEDVEAQGLRLRYWETACAVTDLPFSFTDVPTPELAPRRDVPWRPWVGPTLEDTPVIGCLWLCAALTLAPEDDARALVGRLGAERFDDRVAAIKALEQLGSGALPALREAAASPDLRIRLRARDLIESLARQAEAERFSRPTTVRLDFRDRPLGEVIDTLNARNDLDLVLRTGPPTRGFRFIDPARPDPLTTLKERRITLETDTPVPFWDAVDRLCAAASLRYDVTPQARFGATQGSLVLMGDRTGRSPVSDSGPFRVQMTRVHAAAGRDFVAAPGQAGGALTVSLAVLVEPGLSVFQAGPVQIDEAADDRGRALLLATADGAGRKPGERPRSAPTAGNGSFPVELTLAEPDPPPMVIRRLRGKVPVVVMAREANPLVIPLNRGGATVTTVPGREFTYTVDTAPPGRKGGPEVTVTARPVRGVATRGAGPGSRPLNFGSQGVGYDRGQQHFELFDAAGHRVNHRLGSQSRGADNLGFYDRYQLSVGVLDPSGPAGAAGRNTADAAELRFYEFVQKEFDVPFDFHDLPLP